MFYFWPCTLSDKQAVAYAGFHFRVKRGGDSPKTGEEKRERMKNNEKHKILNKKSIKNLKQKLWSAVAILYMTL